MSDDYYCDCQHPWGYHDEKRGCTMPLSQHGLPVSSLEVVARSCGCREEKREYWYETPDDAVYPEFGTEWREPDGMIWKAIQQAKAEERERIAQAIEAEVPVGFPERYIEKAVAARIARGGQP